MQHKSIIMLLLILLVTTAYASDLSDLLESTSDNVYRSPDKNKQQEAKLLFSEHITGRFESSQKRRWNKLGLQLKQGKSISGQPVIIITPKGNHREGQGLFWICATCRSPVMLQAPHRFNDLYSGEIVSELTKRLGAQAAAWNSTPRHLKDGASGRYSDQTHNTDSYFQSFTRAWAEWTGSRFLIQIHGYRKDKRSTYAGKTSDIIISGGSRGMISPASITIGKCLKEKSIRGVRIYPLDIQELGGTKNQQGKRFRKKHPLGFVHIELSYHIRKNISKKPDILKHLSQCISTAINELQES